MEQYVALDVSLKEISVCVIDGKGAVTFAGKVAAEPAALIGLIHSKAPQPGRVGLETGATSPWRYRAEGGGSARGAHGCTACQYRTLDAADQVRPQRRPRSG
jgi:hypothetical protein